jgi:hypothetical protein
VLTLHSKMIDGIKQKDGSLSRIQMIPHCRRG